MHAAAPRVTPASAEQGSSPLGAIVWLELATPDVGASVSFHAQLLGWNDAPDPDRLEPGYRLLSLGIASVAGVVEHERGARAEAAEWIPFVGVRRADEVVREASRCGGSIRLPALEAGSLGRMALIVDPEGVTFGAWQEREPRDRSWGADGAPSHFELATRDAATAETFYGKAIGWTCDGQRLGPASYMKFHAGERAVAAAVQMTSIWGDERPGWVPYVSVLDVDAIVARATTLGAVTVIAPHRIASVGRLAVIRDPQGARLGLIGRE